MQQSNKMPTVQLEESGIQFTMPAGMIIAEDAAVSEHLLSHSRAVERAAMEALGQSVAVRQEEEDKRQGVPQEVLKTMTGLSFLEALAKIEEEGGFAKNQRAEEREEPAVEEPTPHHDHSCDSCCHNETCAPSPKILGLQVDSEADDHTCEICQSGYDEDDEVHCPPRAPFSAETFPTPTHDQNSARV